MEVVGRGLEGKGGDQYPASSMCPSSMFARGHEVMGW